MEAVVVLFMLHVCLSSVFSQRGVFSVLSGDNV